MGPNGGHPLEVQLAGVGATLAGDYVPFMEYAALHLEPLRTGGAAPARVRATLHWHEGAPPDRASYPELREMYRVDRDLYRNDRQLAWFRIDDLPDLHLRFEWDGETLDVRGDYFHRLSKRPVRDRLKRIIYHAELNDLRRRRFTTLLYYLVYYPCFWWLERERDLHPIHAAGVDVGRGVIVLAGPSGVGKSTLVAGVASSPAARLLSDTFLLHQGQHVYAVPEPLLLDGWSRDWLGAATESLRAIRHRYSLGRNGFLWRSDRLSDGGDVGLLLFPERAPRHYLRALTPEQACGRMRAGDLIVNDLRRYWAFAAATELLDPTPVVHAREVNLARLVAVTPTYEIGLTSAISCDQILELISALLNRSAALQAAGGRP